MSFDPNREPQPTGDDPSSVAPPDDGAGHVFDDADGGWAPVAHESATIASAAPPVEDVSWEVVDPDDGATTNAPPEPSAWAPAPATESWQPAAVEEDVTLEIVEPDDEFASVDPSPRPYSQPAPWLKYETPPTEGIVTNGAVEEYEVAPATYAAAPPPNDVAVEEYEVVPPDPPVATMPPVATVPPSAAPTPAAAASPAAPRRRRARSQASMKSLIPAMIAGPITIVFMSWLMPKVGMHLPWNRPAKPSPRDASPSQDWKNDRPVADFPATRWPADPVGGVDVDPSPEWTKPKNADPPPKKPTEPTKPKPKRPPLADLEKVAGTKLLLARTLAQKKSPRARERLQEIVDDFPETKAADEARRLLGTL